MVACARPGSACDLGAAACDDSDSARPDPSETDTSAPDTGRSSRCRPGHVALLDAATTTTTHVGTLLGFRRAASGVDLGFFDRSARTNIMDLVPWSHVAEVEPPTTLSLSHRPNWTFDPPHGRGDLDGDGAPEFWMSVQEETLVTFDVVSAHAQGAVSLGDWTFEVTSYRPRTLEDDVRVVATGELDGSEGIDLAVVVRPAVDAPPELHVHAGPFPRGRTALTSPVATITRGSWSRIGPWGATVDLDGDDHTDLLIQVTHPDLGAAVLLFRGPLSGAATADEAYATIRTAAPHPPGNARFYCDTPALVPLDVGDVDGDGTPDLLLGLPHEHGTRGAAAVFRGPLRGQLDLDDAWAVVEGDRDGARVGLQGLLTDLDGDGRADVVVGAPDWAEAPTVVRDQDTGGGCEVVDPTCDRDTAVPPRVVRHVGALAVWTDLRPGSHPFEDADALLHPTQPNRAFPSTLLAPGDVDGDGSPDLVVSHLVDFHDGDPVDDLQTRAVSRWSPCE